MVLYFPTKNMQPFFLNKAFAIEVIAQEVLDFQ